MHSMAREERQSFKPGQSRLYHPCCIYWDRRSVDHAMKYLKDRTYQIPNQYMQTLLKQVQQSDNSNIASLPVSGSRELMEQCSLLRHCIHLRQDELDGVEKEARLKAKDEINKATGDDQRKLRDAEKVRQRAAADEYARILELDDKLWAWERSRNK